VVLEEVQQVRHELQVRRDVGVVPEEVHVVEAKLDDVLDAIPQVALVALVAVAVAASHWAGQSYYLRCPADYAKRTDKRCAGAGGGQA
jgi:hypothetical protein